MQIYLASRSPRRRELLQRIGVKFDPLEADVDESAAAHEPPGEYAARMARAKAEAGWQRLLERGLPRAPVLAADTVVALGGRILGKPASRAEAAGMLEALSGRRHEVITAVALKLGARLETTVSVAQVEFRRLERDEIGRYVASGECDDKSGAYAIQGGAARFVAALHGSRSGVMGLPLEETARLIERMGAGRERRSAD